eukprot:g6824.t1
MKCFSEILKMIQHVNETRILDKDPFRNKVSNTVGKDVLENLERNGIRSLSDYTGQEILAAIMIKLDRSPAIMSSEVRKRLVQIHSTSHSNDVVRRFRDFFKTSKCDPLSMTVLWSVCSLISQTDENFRKRMSHQFGMHIFFGNDTSDTQEYANMKTYNAILEIWVAHHNVVFAKCGGKDRSGKTKNAEIGPSPLPVRRVVKKPIVPRVPAPSRGASSSKMRHVERLLKRKKAQLEKETDAMNFEKCVELKNQIDALKRDLSKLKARESRQTSTPSSARTTLKRRTTSEKKNKVKDLESKLQRAVDTMDFEEAERLKSLIEDVKSGNANVDTIRSRIRNLEKQIEHCNETFDFETSSKLNDEVETLRAKLRHLSSSSTASKRLSVGVRRAANASMKKRKSSIVESVTKKEQWIDPSEWKNKNTAEDMKRRVKELERDIERASERFEFERAASLQTQLENLNRRMTSSNDDDDDDDDPSAEAREEEMRQLEIRIQAAAEEMDFETAASLQDRLNELQSSHKSVVKEKPSATRIRKINATRSSNSSNVKRSVPKKPSVTKPQRVPPKSRPRRPPPKSRPQRLPPKPSPSMKKRVPPKPSPSVKKPQRVPQRLSPKPSPSMKKRVPPKPSPSVKKPQRVPQRLSPKPSPSMKKRVPPKPSPSVKKPQRVPQRQPPKSKPNKPQRRLPPRSTPTKLQQKPPNRSPEHVEHRVRNKMKEVVRRRQVNQSRDEPVRRRNPMGGMKGGLLAGIQGFKKKKLKKTKTKEPPKPGAAKPKKSGPPPGSMMAQMLAMRERIKKGKKKKTRRKKRI